MSGAGDYPRFINNISNGGTKMEIKKDTKDVASTVDEYIANYEGEARDRMEKLRALILECSPDISEKISWGMATFVLNGNLIHFAGHKKHLGLYPGAEGVEAFMQKIEGKFKYSKGAIQLPYDKPMPYDLIREIVMFRVQAQTANG